MADNTVTVTALEPHTHQGDSYEPGDTYDVDPMHVDSLVVQGKAAPADPAAHAKKKAGGKYRTTAMEPMTLKDGKAKVRRTPRMPKAPKAKSKK